MNSPASADRRVLWIRRADLGDLERIVAIERDSFPTPWSPWSLRQEITGANALYLVAELEGDVVGYGGMWTAADEAHVGTLAVAREVRRQGIGEALMLALLDQCVALRIARVVLEHRVSNRAAAGLYKKLGFRQTRVRARYYRDTAEDGIEVMLDRLDRPELRERLGALRRDWEASHGGSLSWTP